MLRIFQIWASKYAYDMLMLRQDFPTLPTLCIKTKINSNFYFHTSSWCLEGLHKTFWGTIESENKNFTIIFSLRPGKVREALIVHSFNSYSNLKIQVTDFPSFYEDPNSHSIIFFWLTPRMLLPIINDDALFIKVFLFSRLCVWFLNYIWVKGPVTFIWIFRDIFQLGSML